MIKQGFMGLVLIFSLNANAVDILLSSKVKISYVDPTAIAHSINLLSLKYEDHVVSHEIVTNANIYQNIDIKGAELLFFRSVFFSEFRSKLNEELQLHSGDQAQAWGIGEESFNLVYNSNKTMFGGHNSRQNMGYVFIMLGETLHLIRVDGKAKYFDAIYHSFQEQ